MAVSDIVDGSIDKHFIMVYSKSYCPYCKQTKSLLDSLDLTGDQKPFYIELDEVDNGAEQQEYLAKKTGQRTVPSVLSVDPLLKSSLCANVVRTDSINKKHIGGNSDLQALSKSGELKKLIAA